MPGWPSGGEGPGVAAQIMAGRWVSWDRAMRSRATREWLGRWLVPVLGTLVLASGFLPWYGTAVSVGPAGKMSADQSAWQTSTRWTVAVLLCAAVAGVWAGWRVSGGRVPLVVRLALAGCVLVAVILTVSQYTDRPRMAGPSTVVGVATYCHTSVRRCGEPLSRDHLVVVHTATVNADVRWGFLLALTAMVALSVAIAACSGARLPRSSGASPWAQ